jgi:hypothetical protein
VRGEGRLAQRGLGGRASSVPRSASAASAWPSASSTVAVEQGLVVGGLRDEVLVQQRQGLGVLPALSSACGLQHLRRAVRVAAGRSAVGREPLGLLGPVAEQAAGPGEQELALGARRLAGVVVLELAQQLARLVGLAVLEELRGQQGVGAGNGLGVLGLREVVDDLAAAEGGEVVRTGGVQRRGGFEPGLRQAVAGDVDQRLARVLEQAPARPCVRRMAPMTRAPSGWRSAPRPGSSPSAWAAIAAASSRASAAGEPLRPSGQTSGALASRSASR